MLDRPAKLKAYQTFIDGKWLDAASGKSFETYNPYTGEAWATIPECDKIDVERACEAAACASGNVLSINGLTRPAAISGSTCSSTARAIAPLSGIERARRVEPAWVRRLSMMRRKSTVIFGLR